MVLENEAVVDYAIKNRHVKVIPSEIDIGENGSTNFEDKRFDPTVKMTKKVMPRKIFYLDINNMDGFFFAKLVKVKEGDKKKPEIVKEKKIKKTKEEKEKE